MPSLATRLAISRVTLEIAEEALADAAAAVAAATATLEDIEAGILDLDAITVGGQRFINDGGVLVAEP